MPGRYSRHGKTSGGEKRKRLIAPTVAVDNPAFPHVLAECEGSGERKGLEALLSGALR
jgi:hypothetical protein